MKVLDRGAGYPLAGFDQKNRQWGNDKNLGRKLAATRGNDETVWVHLTEPTRTRLGAHRCHVSPMGQTEGVGSFYANGRSGNNGNSAVHHECSGFLELALQKEWKFLC